MGQWLRGAVVTMATGVCLLAASDPVPAADEVFLGNGTRLTGDLQETELLLSTPHASYRVTRQTVWRIFLGAGGIDIVEFRNGNRLSGLVGQPRYTLRLAGGETRVFERAGIDVIKLDAPKGTAGSRVPDMLLLVNGDHAYGDLMGTEFDVLLESGATRLARESVRRIILDGAVGDSVYLTNGNRLSGIVSQGAYTIRTPDGQALTFSRHEVKDVLLGAAAGSGGAPGAGPVGPGVAAPGPGAPGPSPGPPGAPAPAPGVPGPPPGGPFAAAVPPAALPPAVRTALRDINFEFDRSDLGPEARRTLDDLAAAMKNFPTLRLLIEGHADERGTAEYNLALGARRAEAARSYLRDLGMDPTRIDVISYGEERPLDPEHGETAWALNRRARFVVTSP